MPPALPRHAPLSHASHQVSTKLIRSSNHGDAFLHILNLLKLPQEQIVLHLPAIGPASRWLANYVADNYRRNGFRLAFAAIRVSEAIDLVRQFQPHAVTLDARAFKDPVALARLLELAQAADVNIIVKRWRLRHRWRCSKAPAALA